MVVLFASFVGYDCMVSNIDEMRTQLRWTVLERVWVRMSVAINVIYVHVDLDLCSDIHLQRRRARLRDCTHQMVGLTRGFWLCSVEKPLMATKV
jgi:hypothetical protein